MEKIRRLPLYIKALVSSPEKTMMSPFGTEFEIRQGICYRGYIDISFCGLKIPCSPSIAAYWDLIRGEYQHVATNGLSLVAFGDRFREDYGSLTLQPEDYFDPDEKLLGGSPMCVQLTRREEIKLAVLLDVLDITRIIYIEYFKMDVEKILAEIE